MSIANPILAPHLLSHRQLQDKISRDFIKTKVDVVDDLLQGVPRGAITEVTGAASSGRTTFVNTALAAATRAGEYCALVDASDSFAPDAAAACGVDLSRVLWVRCRGHAEHAMKCADLLIHAGGWGIVALDLAGIPSAVVRRAPISWWYRFRRAVENTPTALIVVETEPSVKSCALLAIDMGGVRPLWSGAHPDFRVLQGARLQVRSRKPVRMETAAFEARALA